MIVLAIIHLASGRGEGEPKLARLSGIPSLFGVCVYSFMCHHSLPSLVTPIRNKSQIYPLFAADYALILLFYCLLSFTGIFTFGSLKDIYTLSFYHNNDITSIKFIQYFLALFPVFTLSTNFPIIGITLRNNLKILVLKEDRHYPFWMVKLVFPLAALLLPVAIALITDNIEFLVGITGSFAGAGIQYFIPTSLVLLSRRDVEREIGSQDLNKHRSPFRHKIWAYFVFVWAIICVAFVAANHLHNWIQGRWS